LIRRLAALLLAMACGAAIAQQSAPLVIAHRGASGYLPEHTLAGYELAIKLGADFIEPDLQLTSDKVLVAMHDDTLQRTTDVAARFAQRNGDWRVADFSLAEIRTLVVKPTGTAGTSYPGFQPTNPELRVPTFDEVIELAKAKSAKSAKSTPERRIGIYPEAKKADPVMEDQILATLVRHGYGDATEEVFIQSFSDATLRSMDAKQAALGTEIPQILLGAAAAMPDGSAAMRVSGGAVLRLADVAAFTEGVGVSISNPDFPVTKSFIDQAHAAGLKVHGWTFAQPDPTLAADEYHRYFEMGMDGVFSNYADLAVGARKRFAQLPR
jgi:glycerophosphoryl diester phosphodiesterase